MKARNIILTMAAAALIVAPGVLFAQQGPGDCDGSGPKGFGGPGDGPGFGPGGPGGHGFLGMLPRLADKLELTEDQQTQIDAIVEAGRTEIEPLMEQAATAREEFHDTYGFGSYDETAYRAFFESQAQLHTEMQLIGAEMMSRAYNVLNSEQQEELVELVELFHGGRGSRGVGKRHGIH